MSRGLLCATDKLLTEIDAGCCSASCKCCDWVWMKIKTERVISHPSKHCVALSRSIKPANQQKSCIFCPCSRVPEIPAQQQDHNHFCNCHCIAHGNRCLVQHPTWNVNPHWGLQCKWRKYMEIGWKSHLNSLPRSGKSWNTLSLIPRG